MTAWQPDRRLLTIVEAAVSVGRRPSTIRAWLAKGRLHAHARRNGQWLILESHLLEVDAQDARRTARVQPDKFGPIV